MHHNHTNAATRLMCLGHVTKHHKARVKLTAKDGASALSRQPVVDLKPDNNTSEAVQQEGQLIAYAAKS